MPDDVFEGIRTRCREVARAARSVRIRCEAIPAYAREIGDLAAAGPSYDASIHYRGRPEDVVAYIVTLDSVNFGSGYFPTLQKGAGMSGYATIARRLTDLFRAEGPIAPERLAGISGTECARIFGQEAAGAAIEELMGLFARAWNDLGRDLVAHCRGSFTRLVDAAEGSAAKLLQELSRQPLFRDVANYGGVPVPFYKRAQILASDLALALDGASWGSFRDLHRLTIFADNVVPHVLRLDGILAYDETLAGRIGRGELLGAGSEEEVEIRACSLDAAERIVAQLRADGLRVAAREVDFLLWNRGRAALYKASPRHRTRTTSY